MLSSRISPLIATNDSSAADVYVGVMRNTIQTWLIVLGLTLLIGYPVAYFISMMVDNPRNQTILLLLAIIPFRTSFLIRVLAWRRCSGKTARSTSRCNALASSISR